MTSDLLTVIRKESIELLHLRGSARGTLMITVLPILILGITFPLQFGREWARSPVTLIAWAWIPLLFTTTIIADSIAGERERHTLETLLASRLPDRAILFGKLLTSMLYGITITALIVFTGLITVNIAHFDEGIILPDPRYLLAGLAVGILGTGFASSAGILISLRAATVRQAQQTLSFGIIIVAVLPGLLVNVLPVELKTRILGSLNTIDVTRAGLAVAVFFLLLDGTLVALAVRRFRRTKLMGG
jgi:ABC-2 type transport system permease protein